MEATKTFEIQVVGDYVRVNNPDGSHAETLTLKPDQKVEDALRGKGYELKKD
jgi:hypothetical protein